MKTKSLFLLVFSCMLVYTSLFAEAAPDRLFQYLKQEAADLKPELCERVERIETVFRSANEDLSFSRNFGPSALHYDLLHVSRWVHLQSSPLESDWADFLLKHHDRSFLVEDALEDIYGKGQLDLTREIEVLGGSERLCQPFVRYLDAGSPELDLLVPDLAALFQSGFNFGLSEKYLRSYVRSKDLRVYVVFDQANANEVVGMAWLYRDEQEDGSFVGSISCVASKAELVGMGIASTLMQEILKDTSYDHFILGVAKDNMAALRLYQNLGFRIEQGPVPELLDGDGRHSEEYFHWMSFSRETAGAKACTSYTHRV